MILGYSIQDKVRSFIQKRIKEDKYRNIMAVMILDNDSYFDIWYFLKRDNIINIQKAINLHYELTVKFNSIGFDVMTLEYENFDPSQYPNEIIIKREA